MFEKEPPTITEGMPTWVSFQPSWRWTKAFASSSPSSRRPISRTVSSITRSSAGMPRPSTATGSPAGWMAIVSRLIAATIDAAGTTGWVAKYSAPSRPVSSAVVARNRMSRAGRGWRASRPAISIRAATPLALSTAPLQIRSASPSGRQVPKWSQWAR